MDTHSQPAVAPPRAAIDDFLTAPPFETREAPRELWGFGGLHGGLTVGAMVAAMRETGASGSLRSVSGRLHRAVREPFVIDVTADAATRSTASLSAKLRPARAEGPQGPGSSFPAAPLASATALFGSDAPAASPVLRPAAPAVPPWHEGGLFNPPPSFVPVAEFYELRVTGTNRPFAGGTDPGLTAWVRLTADDLPPDDLRLLFLVDALAPSYAAILSAPQPIPTVELSVHFTGERAVSPWVLIEARTPIATAGGWITETINVWGEDLTHLAEARQLRLVRPAQAS
ncbi:MAG: thioesterase family protein [Leucobacter sp.]